MAVNFLDSLANCSFLKPFRTYSRRGYLFHCIPSLYFLLEYPIKSLLGLLLSRKPVFSHCSGLTNMASFPQHTPLAKQARYDLDQIITENIVLGLFLGQTYHLKFSFFECLSMSSST